MIRIQHSRFTQILALIILFISTIFISHSVYASSSNKTTSNKVISNKNPSNKTEPNKAVSEQNFTIATDALSQFKEAYHLIKSSYINETNDQQLITAAIRGMVQRLDEHSQYFDKTELAILNAQTDGQYAGVGLGFVDHPLGLKIINVIKNSPAYQQSISQGMVLTAINDLNIKNISAKDAYKLLQGEVDSKVKLRLALLTKNKISSVHNYQLTRKVIEIPSVKYQLLPHHIGYLALSQFTRKSATEFTEAIGQLSVKQPINKIIIDLRNNLGGVIESAIQISDYFIDSGKILISTGRAEDANETYLASKITPYKNFDVVILVNANTASASEFLAAALQEHHLATVIGEPSYGKGTIQSIYFLAQDAGLKITTAQYFTPKGHKIQDIGIKPDITFNTKKLKNHYPVKSLNNLELLQAFEYIKTIKRK